ARVSWEVPQAAVTAFEVQRRDDRTGEFVVMSPRLEPDPPSWLDTSVENGHTYEYRVLGYDLRARLVAESSVAVRLDLAPVLSLDQGEAYSASRTVTVNLLATTAESMRLANGPDPSSSPWQTKESEFTWTLAGADGPKVVSCQVRYDTGEVSETIEGQVVLDTTPPATVLSLDIDPSLRQVTVDASGTLDACPPGSLEYFWNWGDGLMESTSEPIAIHRYRGPGAWRVSLQVQDCVGWTSAAAESVSLSNGAPAEPRLLRPRNDAQVAGPQVSLGWQQPTDLESDAVHYRVYLSRVDPPSIFKASWDGTSLVLADLEYRTKYYWRVVAVDEWGAVGPSSPTWSFDTGPRPGPNRDGVLLLHTNDAVVYSQGLSYRGTSGRDCQDDYLHCPPQDAACIYQVKNATSGRGADTAVWWVLAAFPPSSCPRVAGVTFGIGWNDDETITLVDHGACGDFEIPQPDWPASGSGTAVTWTSTRLTHLLEVYWFAGYAPDGPAVFELRQHPTQSSSFADDSVPSGLNAIPSAAMGTLGLNGAVGDLLQDPAISDR
ncbi:MAG: hypothetical protein KC729_08075, partial [Candidatus Eisenbacteria bacterium]|nr:hypothetical protein [Candidatus Eisenbacteria bacterium]